MKRGRHGFDFRTLYGLLAAGSLLSGTAAVAQETPGNKAAVKYVKVDTKNYTLEVPEGWEVGQETSFGQREIVPEKKEGDMKAAAMSSMTGPGLGKRSWDDLYKTSLYFITRYDNAQNAKNAPKPTPYTLSKSKQGFEACSWSMLDADKTTKARYVILKSQTGNILALSVKIPSKESKAKLDAIFDHMVATAVVK